MKRAALNLPVIVAALWSLCSCAPVPRQVPYSEAAFAPYRGSGSGMVAGNDTEADSVILMPDTDYTEEIVRRAFDRGKNLEPPDPRFAKYVRSVNTYHDGDFVFDGVRPGHYIVYCYESYETTFDQTNDDGSSTFVPETESRLEYARITVKSGQTTKVDNWVQGR